MDMPGFSEPASAYPPEAAEADAASSSVGLGDGRTPFVTAEQAFRAIFDAAPYGLLLVASDGRIALTNGRLDAMFGYGPGELVGRAMELLLPSRHRGGHVELRQTYASQPTTRPMGSGRDLTGLRRDGVEFPVEIGLNAIDTDQGPLMCACVVDITARKRGELKLREANAQLEEFTQVASHDLRSPIRGIGNLIDFIREDYGDQAPESVKRNLARMSQRVAETERLIRDLLTYARAGRQVLKRDIIDLRSLIATVIELEAPPPGAHITVEAPEQTFEGARIPLETVIRNLLANAVRHHDLEEMNIAIVARYSGEHCIIEVRDDGPGIPEAAHLRIFRLFQTLSDKERKGGGLGLAVVQRLVEGHGGSILVESTDGKRGSTFRVWWPRFVRSEFDD